MYLKDIKKYKSERPSFKPALSRLMAKKVIGAFISMTLLFRFALHAQDPLPQNYFINPLDIPISLAGTFGEIRSNHYHTGIDIRTESREGLIVHAAANGYVSRIVVSPWGYGNALYVTHPNGYITLYGHLSRFNDTITHFVKNRQYAEEKYLQDISLTSGKFNVNQGDTIAFSGSTGSTEGPHLHFEIRDARNDDPINPLLAGYTSVDKLPPIIESVALYPLNDSSNINGKHQPLYLKVKKINNRYVLASDSAISAYGSIGAGISCYDMANGVGNHNGPYIKILKDNNDTIYYSRMDVLNFATIHYVNGHVDYAAMNDEGDILEYSFLQENDKLKIYKKLVNRGYIDCKPGETHALEYIISDFNGNTSKLAFTIHDEKTKPAAYHDTTKYVAIAHWDKPFEYSDKGMKIEIPAGILFNTLHFHYTVTPTLINHTGVSNIYNIQDENTPLSGTYTLMLKPAATLPDSVMRRAVIVRVEGKRRISIGGKWDSGYMIAHPKTFGSYAIMLDLYHPVIKPVNIFKDKDMSHDSLMAFEVSDNLSGISSFRGTVDGKWILMEFNPKKNWVYYVFDEHVGKGKHHLRLWVSDEVGNTSVFETEFTR